MQHRTNIHDVRISIARLGNSLVIPAFKLPALLRRIDVLIIFHVVQHKQVWTPVPVAASTDLFS